MLYWIPVLIALPGGLSPAEMPYNPTIMYEHEQKCLHDVTVSGMAIPGTRGTCIKVNGDERRYRNWARAAEK